MTWIHEIDDASEISQESDMILMEHHDEGDEFDHAWLGCSSPTGSELEERCNETSHVRGLRLSDIDTVAADSVSDTRGMEDNFDDGLDICADVHWSSGEAGAENLEHDDEMDRGLDSDLELDCGCSYGEEYPMDISSPIGEQDILIKLLEAEDEDEAAPGMEGEEETRYCLAMACIPVERILLTTGVAG